MKILFFDTETNGLPRDWRAKMSDLKNWPRVIQLAFEQTDMKGNVLADFCSLIKPEGWEVPKEPFWEKKGYSTEGCDRDGIYISNALNRFVSLVNESDVVVAHNMNFDFNVLGAEMIRADVKAAHKPQKVCTMTVSTDLLKLPGRFEGTYKFPKLEELHRWLFNEDFEGAHDALVDVRACRRCFFELMNRGHILVNEKKELTIKDVHAVTN